MKTVVITGASSFVGCHLAREFAQKGCAVTATGTQTFDAYKGIQAERLKWIGGGVSWQALDLCNEQAVRSFIARVRPELWVHHAGYAVNYGGPDYDVCAGDAVNVAPLAYIYEELAKAKCGGVIVTGSSMEYSDTDQACLESDECKPSTPYGRSKLEETQAAAKLSALHNVPTRVARLFIPFGPLDAPAKVLMYVVENLKKGLPIDLSPCTQRRDFLYIGDVAKAYGSFAGDLKRGGFDIFNICSGEAVAVRSLIEMIVSHLGASSDLLGFGKRSMRPGEPAVSYGSCERARQVLGWEPNKPEAGIKELLRDIQ
ncbi:MAG: NAD(P)-dependent oxidoreductase [Nitrospirae bacterium]|nr:MAG: NAD(P)-dependent oxidoreductase [Nitrospirota bacterium]